MLAACVAVAAAQAPLPETQPVEFDGAEFAPVKSLRPPPDDVGWKPVMLPDNWYVTRPDASGGWYRIVLPLTAVPRRVHAVYLPRGSATTIRAFVNGNIIGSTYQRPETPVQLNQQALIFSAPPAVFRHGRNVLHIYVEGESQLRHGLTRLWFGDGPLVRELWLRHFHRQVVLVVAFGFAVVAAGLITLAVWARLRHDAAFLWFGLAAVLLGVPAIVGSVEDMRQLGAWREVVQLAFMHAYAPPLALGAMHLAGVVRRGIAIALWTVLGLGALMPLVFGQRSYPSVTLVLGLVFLAILNVAFSMLLVRKNFGSRWVRAAVVAALVTAIVFAAHDTALWMAWIDYEGVPLRPFIAPVITLALGVLLISRQLDAVLGLKHANETLEMRVAERACEIERSHGRVRTLEAERARAGERQRIMADIHDGLGSSLVSLLSVVQGGRAGLKDVERRVHDALLELRLAIDTQDTPQGDLVTALATVRYRMRDALEAAEIEFVWNVGDLPRLDDLTPGATLDFQRIVLEALTNAIRHARPSRIEVCAWGDGAAVRLVITDDGCGFDPAAPRNAGRGLITMRRRAAAIGGVLTIAAQPGSGTRLTLDISRAARQRSCQSENEK